MPGPELSAFKFKDGRRVAMPAAQRAALQLESDTRFDAPAPVAGKSEALLLAERVRDKGVLTQADVDEVKGAR